MKAARIKPMIKKCVICGKDFNSPPSAKTVTCSAKCRSERAKRAATNHKLSAESRKKISDFAKANRIFLSTIHDKAIKAAMKSKKAGRFTTNSSAKTYTLISPDGEEIEVTNLQLWAREHCDLFDFEFSDENAKRISHGFYTIWKNIRNNKRGQRYKGWTIYAKDCRKNCEKKKGDKN